MPVNRKLKLVFVHIPRTGGRAVCEALDMRIDGDKHERASWYREKYKNFVLFTVYRNWGDRLRSSQRATNPAERLFLLDNDYFLDVDVDYILSYKYLNKDLNRMLADLNIKPVKLPIIT